MASLIRSKTQVRKLWTLFAKIVCPSLLLVTSVYAQDPRPPANYADNGACPFECCTYRRWSVTRDTVLYQQRSEKSAVAFRVRKGDHVTGVTGVVITLKPGKAIVRRATTIGEGRRQVKLKQGDVLYLLHYMGEGFFKIWFRGKIYENEMPDLGDAKSKIQVLNQPDTVWWMKVKNSRNQVGWSKQNDNFGDIDACG
jgi:hypothetical protein